MTTVLKVLACFVVGVAANMAGQAYRRRQRRAHMREALEFQARAIPKLERLAAARDVLRHIADHMCVHPGEGAHVAMGALGVDVVRALTRSPEQYAAEFGGDADAVVAGWRERSELMSAQDEGGHTPWGGARGSS